VADADPSSLINIVLNGSARIVVAGMPDAYRMPQFRVLLRDEEIAEIVSFIRQSWGNTASPVTPEQVSKIRRASEAASDAVVILKMR
jgi:mono/diheme cytochrome c family protein